MLSDEQLRAALRRAFALGQTYFQQAYSQSHADNRRSDQTRAKFDLLVMETSAQLRDGIAGVMASQAPSIPEGWKLVPVTPTNAMLEAAYMAFQRAAPSFAGFMAKERAYRALLDHAPLPPDAGVLASVEDRARTLYAQSPRAYRGTRPLAWDEAPSQTRQEFIDKAKAESAAGVMASGELKEKDRG